jgi:hypothetical protein
MDITKVLMITMCWVAGCKGELEWSKTRMSDSVHPVQESATFSMHFKNTGSEVIQFVNVQGNCSCIDAGPEKKSYAPGEEGAIKIEFDLRGRTGAQKKTIHVVTSDKPKETVSLTVEVTIPQSYTVPGIIEWKKGEPLEPKMMTLKNKSTFKVVLEEATSSDERFVPELFEIKEGFEYQLKVYPPTESGGRLWSAIQLKTQPPPGMKSAKNFRSYARVR